ncbi:hypothetical protein [Donghicola mangrovi]|uniref:DUF1554 domain-containing protein n=1 Tax=Donghicola mangrovi TaxID=2729614 RepID=A0A850Q823_9RHOB|nr:hypothetical protein [Donghicola mangrovi]NVO24372.1 hypothetical protein [Donghicola mangrovi]
MRISVKNIVFACLGTVSVFLGAQAAQAQSNTTDPAFCDQYAGYLRRTVTQAIQMNPRCLDWDRGVHDVYQMHYDWCLRNPRDSVAGAADHVRDLVIQCTGDWFEPSPLQTVAPPPAPAPAYAAPQGRWQFSGGRGICEAELWDNSKPEFFGNLLRLELWDGKIRLISSYTGGIGATTFVSVNGQQFPLSWDSESDTIFSYVDMPLIQAMKSGNQIDLGFDNPVLRYTLSGSSAAIDQMLQCAGMGAPKPKPAPAASKGPKVIYGSCKLIVDGVQYVNMPANCPIWMDTDGTFWINTDRENYLGDFFAEISPFGDGTAGGHWNAERGATHAQAPLGEGFRLGKNGCWSNARATVCAAR